jgi:hypothetical protein
MQMNTLRKQKPILKNGKKERLLKMLRLKKELQILRENLKKSTKKLIKNTLRNKRKNAKKELINSNL